MPQDPDQTDTALAIAIAKGLEKAEAVGEEAYKLGIAAHTGHYPSDADYTKNDEGDSIEVSEEKTTDEELEGGENIMVNGELESKRVQLQMHIDDALSAEEDVEDQKAEFDGAVEDVVDEVDQIVDEYAENAEHAAELYDHFIDFVVGTEEKYSEIDNNLEGMTREMEAAYNEIDRTLRGSPPDLDPLEQAVSDYNA